MKPATFFGKIKAGAYYNWRTYKVLPSLAGAQAAIESGWGESGLTKQANNLFGMKGSYNGSSVTMRTAEAGGGGTYYINAAFRKYPSWNASIVDYAHNLRKSGFYPASAFRTTSYVTQINLIGHVYATDPNYAQKIISTVRNYGLDKWDKDAIAGGKGGDFDPSEINVGGSDGEGDEQYKTFQEDYIKKNSSTRPKLKLKDVKGIVIHEVKTTASTASFRNTLNSGWSGKKHGFHIIVDSSSARIVVPLDEGVHHANRTGHLLTNEFGNPDNSTISIAMLHKGGAPSTKLLTNLILATAEVARLYKIGMNKIVAASMVDGVIEPEYWEQNNEAYSVFVAFVESVKKEGAAAITNPNYGTGDDDDGGSSGGALIPGGSGAIKKLLEEAMYWRGKLSYSMGMRYDIHPGGHADCSSFTHYVFKKATGKEIGGNTWAQVVKGKGVPISQMRAGDLVFWEKTYPAPPPTHVGIVASGKGSTAKVIQCGNAGVTVITANVIPHLYAARRMFSDSDYEKAQEKPKKKSNLSTKASYVAKVVAPTNAYSADSGGYTVKRLSTGEVYKVAALGANSLGVKSRNNIQSLSLNRSAYSLLTAFSLLDEEPLEDIWIPIHSEGIEIAQLPNKDSSIGSAIIKIPVKVLDRPTNNGDQIYEGGGLKTFGIDESVPIYAIENRFGQVDPIEEKWITLASAYCDLSVDLETSLATEVDFSKGQTIETLVIGRLLEEDITSEIADEGYYHRNGKTGWAYTDLLPIGSVIHLDIPTDPSLSRDIVIISNDIKTEDGNNIEIYFDNELDRYKFGSRNALVTLIKTLEDPEDIMNFLNGEENTEVDDNTDYDEEDVIFE